MSQPPAPNQQPGTPSASSSAPTANINPNINPNINVNANAGNVMNGMTFPQLQQLLASAQRQPDGVQKVVQQMEALHRAGRLDITQFTLLKNWVEGNPNVLTALAAANAGQANAAALASNAAAAATTAAAAAATGAAGPVSTSVPTQSQVQTQTSASTPTSAGAPARVQPTPYANANAQAPQTPQQQQQLQMQLQVDTAPRPSPLMGGTATPGTIDAFAPDYSVPPVMWPTAQQGRPTLTGGIPGGRLPGTPAAVARLSDDVTMLNSDGGGGGGGSRRKNTPGDQSMRRSIQDLVSSIDPGVKIEAEVEDLLLEIADEFIDSVTNFGCRLAKHRGADTLEVRDLQLHLERNHNIRIPGFASDETRLSVAQTSAAANAAAPAAGAKKAPGTHMTLRSHRLAQVQQAKRDGKLL